MWLVLYALFESISMMRIALADQTEQLVRVLLRAESPNPYSFEGFLIDCGGRRVGVGRDILRRVQTEI
jgi:hypothetical protein